MSRISIESVEFRKGVIKSVYGGMGAIKRIYERISEGRDPDIRDLESAADLLFGYFSEYVNWYNTHLGRMCDGRCQVFR